MVEFQASVEDTDQDDDAAVWIEPGIENQGPERFFGIALGVRDLFDDRFQDFVNADTLFGAGENSFRGVDTDNVFDLLTDAFGVGGRQVNLVDDRDDFQVVVQGEVGVRKSLGFHALGGIDNQQRAFAGLQTAFHFVGEVHVTWGIDEVELVHLPIVGFVVEADGVGFDGDATLSFQVHRVEDLRHHFTLLKRAGYFEQTVGKRALAVIDVGDDGEVPDEFWGHAVRWG